MKAAVVSDFTQPLSIENVAMPEPSDGQVLVLIEALDRVRGGLVGGTLCGLVILVFIRAMPLP